MKKKIFLILIAFVVGLTTPSISVAATTGLIATPKGAIREYNGALYIEPNQGGIFEARYCGKPEDNLPNRRELILTIQIVGEIDREVTDIAIFDNGDTTGCPDGYYGNIVTFKTWTPTEDLRDKQLSWKVSDTFRSTHGPIINIKPSPAPDEDTDPEPIIGDDPETPSDPNLDLNRDNFSGWEGVFSNIFKLQPGLNTPSGIANKVLEVFLTFVAIAAVVVLIYAGWIYVTSGGDSAKAEKGKKAIIGSIIGIIIVMLTFTIIRFISNLL